MIRNRHWVWWICCLIILSGFCTHVTAQNNFESKRLNVLLERRGWIRIGLTQNQNSALVQMDDGGIILIDGRSVRCNGGTVSFKSAGSVVQGEVPGVGPVSGNEVLVEPIGGIWAYNGKSYRGKARVIARGGKLSVINEIMIDDWLKGVLPAEIGKDSPMEALKAQAVAGRSEAVFRLLVPPHKNDGYDFCTGVHCQAYKGIEAETAEVRKACDDTLGYVLLAEGDILNAVYHNVCGGVTAAAEDVWDSKPVPGLSPVYDKLQGNAVNLGSDEAVTRFILNDGTSDFCFPGNPGYANYAKKYFRWTKTLTASEAGKAAGVGVLTDIAVTERRPSGRVRQLTVRGTNGTKTFEKELNIRRIFDLWSGLFVVEIRRNGSTIESISFVGAGNGHGVGLCQHGAREIARRGGTYDQILGHYYRNARLQKVYRP